MSPARERPGEPGGKRDSNRRRRIEQIAGAALELFCEHGVATVTMEQIAERAAVAKGSVYHYFGDKQRLVESLIAPFADAIRGALATCHEAVRRLGPDDDPARPFAEMARNLAAAAIPHRDILRLYLQESRSPAIGARRPLRELGDDFATRAIDLGLAARERQMFRDFDPRVPPLVIIGAVERLLFEHFCNRPMPSPDAIARDLVSLLVDGLRKPAPAR